MFFLLYVTQDFTMCNTDKKCELYTILLKCLERTC